MVLKLFNTLERRETDFVPLEPPTVKIYSCGPTVYDYAHIGNWRTFIFNDLLVRSLEYLGFKPTQVMNITDVDDKTIAGAAAAGQPLAEFTAKYENIFLADLHSLNCRPPATMPHATAFIPAMIELISQLLKNDQAYVADDGVYFKIASFADYGQLSGRTGEDSSDKIRSASEPASRRVKTANFADESKSDERDFALWKFETPADQGTAWTAPFGRGRPGWHIECSAMIEQTLGTTIDIHTGAVDLIFPHHENEIAQSASAHDAPLARYWLHGEFLLVDGQKMSKSLGNIYTLKDLAEHGISPLAFRYWLLTGHYRSPLNFTWEAVKGAQNRLERLKRRLATLPDGGTAPEDLRAKFVAALSNDLNFPQALALIPSYQNQRPESLSPAAEKATWLEFDRVFGLNLATLTN